MPQREFVPRGYRELSKELDNPHVNLGSTDWNFTFEAVRPNLFRTTFSSQTHPLPPHPSVQKPKSKLEKSQYSVETHKRSKVFRLGDVVASIDWQDTPLVSLSYVDVPEAQHHDLPLRSYAVDGPGIAHYTRYKQATLHVGLGEKAAPFNLSNRHFILNATDCFGYDVYRTDPLYKYIPLLINATPQGCVAMFSTSHSRGTWSVGSEVDGLWGRFKVYRQDYGGLEEYIMIERTLKDVVQVYADLVGYPLLVPRWAFGYISGGMKYSMLDEPRASEAILTFLRRLKEEDIPCSSFQISSGYTVSQHPPKTRNVFTWNHHRFPNPAKFTAQCHELGIRLLANVKPYVLANHPDYNKLSEAGALFTDPRTNTTALARLWSAGGGESGEGGHVDFTSNAGFRWWYDGVQSLRKIGIDAIWNDNNEYTIPDDDWECALETKEIVEPHIVGSRKVGIWGRAIHAELMGKSSHDALVDLEPYVRPFVLTRSATAGTMRYACSSWSGDNVTSWEGMKGGNSIALNAGISLLQCYGYDTAGFEGPLPTPELLLRWIQLGIYTPRFAINCFKTSPGNNSVGDVIEPFMYPEITPLVRKTIKRRYELIPYLYSLALQSHLTACPPMRWLGWGHEDDDEVWTQQVMNRETQYWLGDALLIGGVYEPGIDTARMYLPSSKNLVPGDGYINLNQPHQHLSPGQWVTIQSEWKSSIPLLARIGTAIPTGKPFPTSSSREPDAVFARLPKDDYRAVEIFPPIGSSKGRKYRSSWYEDDGMSRDPEIVSFWIEYGCEESRVHVRVWKESVRGGEGYSPGWEELVVVLPWGDERDVATTDGEPLEGLGKDDTGRKLWKTKSLFP